MGGWVREDDGREVPETCLQVLHLLHPSIFLPLRTPPESPISKLTPPPPHRSIPKHFRVCGVRAGPGGPPPPHPAPQAKQGDPKQSQQDLLPAIPKQTSQAVPHTSAGVALRSSFLTPRGSLRPQERGGGIQQECGLQERKTHSPPNSCPSHHLARRRPTGKGPGATQPPSGCEPPKLTP